ncbi:trimethylguanosine synthase-like [Daktulosphaira vitifoliae]|uniref:trimethylguanosine synthase-like n=1 Tax=Daktulosphaira vitifoliae TaxID=58002 RepID=UPI0021AA6E1F|nr:trimethylguanosine synthase-like [Daktulosphaira vitifoliae]
MKSKTKPISTSISTTDINTKPILTNILSDHKSTETSTLITTVGNEENIFENNTPDNSIETNLRSAFLNISHPYLPNNDLTDNVTICQLQNATEVCKNNISTQINHSTESIQSHTLDSSFTSNTSQIKHNLDSNSTNKTCSHDIPKYLWNKRHFLFEKFDDGILLDYESFYSVCPEILSKHIAKRYEGYNVAMDPFCGAGDNVIQLAMKYKKVIAISINVYSPEEIGIC